MAIDAIIFDLDGTLVDTNRAHLDSWLYGLRENGYEFGEDRVVLEIGKGSDLLLPALVGATVANRIADDVGESVKEVFNRIAQKVQFPIFTDAEKLLRELRARGIKLALATSAASDDLDVIMKSAGVDLRKYFDHVVTKTEVESSKPEPDVVRAAAKGLGVSPAQCAMVGDTPYDVASAKKAGVVTLGVLSGGLSGASDERERLAGAGARAVFKDVSDIYSNLDKALEYASPSNIHFTESVQRKLMQQALAVAEEGLKNGEAPIGCILVDGNGETVARAYNEMLATENKTAHAEIMVFSKAAGKTSLDARDLTLVSTLEPCVMCLGASMESAVDTILFALPAPLDSGTARVTPPQSPENQMPRVVGGICAQESRRLFERWLDMKPPEPGASYARSLLSTNEA